MCSYQVGPIILRSDHCAYDIYKVMMTLQKAPIAHID
jgi:hypothetical protein